MPSNANRQFLDFEKPIKDLIDEIEGLKHRSEQKKINYSEMIAKLEQSILDKRKEITDNLSSWQRVQLSRHPDRPYTMKYIEKMTTNFIELFGDRNVKDDKAMIGGFAMLEGETVMIIGQQKGINTKMRQMRNFGMANPEGYRKALRLMKLAEKFNKPVITLIDTPGAFPGLEAEERGQGEAIARNIYEMIRLKVPVIVAIIGEGASGGALGIGVGDRVFMMENTWYTVISPESCSSILWRSWDQKENAAEQLQLTAVHMKRFGLVDDIIPEPVGGAHWDYNEAAIILKDYLKKTLQELKAIPEKERINQRIEKFGKMGFWEEVGNNEQEIKNIEQARPDDVVGRGIGNNEQETGNNEHEHNMNNMEHEQETRNVEHEQARPDDPVGRGTRNVE
ncbi:MAG TPA: acetyl-CoA carboxylase carboxyltransferase subunit alpha [Chitinophagaceae bacterium]|nr:acetyl-CoA carboxylase carboxyltransferase subunit alpha [Chitinophagaceae bacterium]